ncbi:SpoIIE family protein phosphatase [bacterium]|nr:SpoIIE family protein phosphatase [candidate division CSSED10-310 bacterium]
MILVFAGLSVVFSGLMLLTFFWPEFSTYQNLLILLSGVCLFYLFKTVETKFKSPADFWVLILGSGIIAIISEWLRIRFPGIYIQKIVFSCFGLPAAFLGGMVFVKLVYTYRGFIGKSWFLIVVVISLIFRSPNSGLLITVFLLSQIPFGWVRKSDVNRLYQAAVSSVIFLLSYYILIGPHVTLQAKITPDWAFLPAGVYTAGFSLILTFAWTSVIFGIFLPLRPQRIRSRLRLAFFLNFFVPTLLITIISIASLLFLLGGYQAATAKRLLFQIGAQAREQSLGLWETAQGISRQPPAPSPFYRVGAVKLADGTVQEWKNPPIQLVEKLEAGDTYDMEFLVVNEPLWELWIAGFYRAPDGSGATIAYRVDREMLLYIREIIGFELKLMQDFDWGFLPFSETGDDKLVAETYYTSENYNNQLYFPIGAMLITSLKDEGIFKLDQISFQPLATLEIVASRETLSRSLITTSSLRNFLLNIKIGSDIPLQGSNFTTSAEMQSTNILNLIMFFILSLTAGLFAGLILLSTLTSYVISRKINQSLDIIKRGTSQLQKGNLEYRIPVLTEDELGNLAADFNAMADSIKAYQEKQEQYLKEKMEQDRLKKEFETARLIQNSLLPYSDPIHTYYEVTGACLPAAEVGGDYFDYLNLPEGKFGIAIGDVSGHGMSAGLLMSMAKSCLSNQIRTSWEVKDVMYSLNHMVCDSVRQRILMTFLYGVFDPETSDFTFASAGHHFPYIYRSNQGVLDEVESISYPLGVRREIQFQIQKTELKPGDLVVFYTDGIIEMQNPSGELFGFERFEAKIIELAHLPVQKIKDEMLSELNRFKKGHKTMDDITIVLVKIKRNI